MGEECKILKYSKRVKWLSGKVHILCRFNVVHLWRQPTFLAKTSNGLVKLPQLKFGYSRIFFNFGNSRICISFISWGTGFIKKKSRKSLEIQEFLGLLLNTFYEKNILIIIVRLSGVSPYGIVG